MATVAVGLCAEQALVIWARQGDGAEGAEVVGHELGVDDGDAACVQVARQCGKRKGGGAGAQGEHGFGAEDVFQADAIDAADEQVALPEFAAVRAALLVQGAVGGNHVLVDPAFCARVAAGVHDAGEGAIKGEMIISVATAEFVQAAAGVKMGAGQDGALGRRPPQDGVDVAEPGKDAATVRGKDTRRGEVAAKSQQTFVIGLFDWGEVVGGVVGHGVGWI